MWAGEAAVEYVAGYLATWVEAAEEHGDLAGYEVLPCRQMAVALAQHVSRYDAVQAPAGYEWSPRLDLLRARQERPGDDDGRALARLLGWSVERTRMALSALRRIGAVDWDGPRTQIRHIRLLVQDGRPVEREGVVLQFSQRRRKRTVLVRAS